MLYKGNAMKTVPAQAIQDIHAFTDEAREAIYQTIFSRRDVRGQFAAQEAAASALTQAS